MRSLPRGSSAGFSLVEVLVAMALLAIGMLAVARMFAGSIALSGRAGLMTDAGLAAQALTESVRSAHCPTVDGDSVAGPLRIRWTARAGIVSRIEVRVTAPAADSLRTDTVTAYAVCGS